MKKSIVAGIIVGAAISVGVLSNQGKPGTHIGPEYLYPNPLYTVGVAETLNPVDLTNRYDGLTYSQAHRNVPASESQQVYKEYGIASHSPGEYEVDHFYPMCAGASNDIKNLWPQPAVNVWNGKDYGFHTKDKLESYVCEQIKAGKLDPKIAFQRITSDWVAYYNDIMSVGASLGGVESLKADGD